VEHGVWWTPRTSYADDLPELDRGRRVGGGAALRREVPHLVRPYALDTNDDRRVATCQGFQFT